MRFTICFFLMFLALNVFSIRAEEGSDERAQGIAALKESQSNPAAIVGAARHFAKAAELFVKTGDEAKATEMNSFLFWCKKKMSYQDIEQFTKSGEKSVVEKLFMVEKIVPEADESPKWLDRAEKFATENPTEHLLIAVRFFEVASRFVGSKASIAAQERSLKEQALALEKSTAPNTTPAVESNSNDPIWKRIAVAKKNYSSELESAHKTMLDTFDKRESDARKLGNKKGVDQVKEDRTAFETKTLSDRIFMYPLIQKNKIAAAWKSLSTEYGNAIKEFTKAAKDADATAAEKEYKVAADDYAPAAFAPGKFEPDSTTGVFRDKTFVVWMTMPTNKQDSFAVMSLEAPLYHFDGVGLGEITPGKWMALSDSCLRSEANQSGNITEAAGPGAPLQIAITYADKQVTLYRNGKRYSQYQMTSDPWKFGPDSYVLFGLRSLLSAADFCAGTIHDARIYTDVLTEAQIAALQPRVASGPKPWAWWTFDDGTCRDRMGRFHPGKLVSGVTIKAGVLILNGKGYVRCDPSVPAAKKK